MFFSFFVAICKCLCTKLESIIFDGVQNEIVGSLQRILGSLLVLAWLLQSKDQVLFMFLPCRFLFISGLIWVLLGRC
jgi:hypothetical protein